MEAARNGTAAATSPQPLTKVMVFCDGTWCGQLTGTNTNVKILADAVAGTEVSSEHPFEDENRNIVVRYFDGESVQGGFADYILDGAIGGRIKENCLEVYKFLMEEFEKRNGHCEAWLIGLSRGSYTVRCVAGMINNCGLISAETMGIPDQDVPETVLQRAYGYYRNRAGCYTPNSRYMQEWKRHHSRTTPRSPVKFMGLFETVGSLGIPALNPGMGVEYDGRLNFYDTAVSGEVERVYQALAVHDRCSVFNPCHVKRDKQNREFSYSNRGNVVDYRTEELWFPGAHYDLGRQRFMFYKSPNVLPARPWDGGFLNLATQIASNITQNAVTIASTRVLRIPEIHPNYEFSNLVLAWMIHKMAETDRAVFGSLLNQVMNSDVVAPPPRESRLTRFFNWVTRKPVALENDAYDHLVDNAYLGFDLVPFAHRFLVGLLNRSLLMDRIIQDPLPGPALPDPAPPGHAPPGPGPRGLPPFNLEPIGPAPLVPVPLGPAPPGRQVPQPPPVRFLNPERHLIGDEGSYRSRTYDSYKEERLAMQRGPPELVNG